VTAVTALVVAHRGGPALAATLASLDWTARRCVADPAAAVAADAWPPGAERWTASDPSVWTLLLMEGECVAPGFAAALASADDGNVAARVAIECHAFGGAVRLRGQPVRLQRGRRPEIEVALGGEVAFVTAGDAPLLTGAVVTRRLGTLPADAVDALNAEASALAALAAARGVRPRFARLLGGGVAGAARVLAGRSNAPLGWGRWIAAVLAGYRGLLAEAKLWERAQLGVPPP
jgi:hypothetical protein